jgi:hypothetical protein
MPKGWFQDLQHLRRKGRSLDVEEIQSHYQPFFGPFGEFHVLKRLWFELPLVN